MQKGFTLMEVLVSVAIIGVLSAIVLASLNNSRSKANDSTVKASLSNLRRQAELVYDASNRNCYSNTTTGCGVYAKGTCPTAAPANTLFGDNVVLNQLQVALDKGGGLSSCELTNNAFSYAIAVQLKGDLALAWCVDSAGQSKQVGTPGGAALNQAAINLFITSGRCN